MDLKPIRLFPLIYNRPAFIENEHPEMHPMSSDYATYWEDKEKKCLEGMWGLDSDGTNGGWRYMPPFLYYYINICKIVDEDEDGNPTIIISPELRDVEWMLSYGWLTAKGFSGFDGDTEYTCHRIVDKIEKKVDLTPKEKILIQKQKKYITKPDGSYKKYVEAREYLYQTHKQPLGKPYYHNENLNFFVLGSRGFGKSFFCANAVIGHEFNFYGKKYFDEAYLKDPSPVEIFVGSGLASKSSELLDKFDLSQKYLHKHIGAWGEMDEFIPGYFYNNNSGSLKPNNADNPYRHEYKKKLGSKWTKAGTKTKIVHGVYTAENPQAAVGTRPTVMVIEEVGLLSKLLTVHGANETCQIRRTKFGSSFYIGTGGDIEKITEPKIVFLEPVQYNMVPYRDVFENRPNPIGFFLPAYYVDSSFKDEHGNTLLEEAFEQEMVERNTRRKAANSAAYDEYIMARPIVPSEMFLSKTANIFPVAMLRDRLTQVEIHNLDHIIGESVGWLEYTNNGDDVKWVPDLKNIRKPIKELNLDIYKNNLEGGIVIYEHPPDHLPPPTYRNNLYKVVYDPLKDDGEGTSLAAVLVYKGLPIRSQEGGMTNTIVAEYIGRMGKVEDVHEVAIKLAMYYNAKILPETNISDFLRYCRMKKKQHLLQPTPWASISKILKNPKKKFEVGVYLSNKELKVQAEQLLAQWLLTPVAKTTEDEEEVLNLHNLYTRKGLQELIHYDRDKGNWDYVSALLVLALWLAQEYEQEVDLYHDPTKKYDKLTSYSDRYKKRRTVSLAKNPYYDW